MKRFERYGRKLLILFCFLFLLLSMVSCGSQTDSQPTSLKQGNAAEETTQDVKSDPAAEQPPATQPSADETSGNEVKSAGAKADVGFRPNANGFSFENYGNADGVTNLTAVEIKRMFGDKACAVVSGDSCTLIPPAQQFMEQLNESMNNGHCEGMAVLSDVFFTGKADPAKFGSSAVKDLQLKGNETLQREIAYWYATQITNPASQSIIAGTPADIVDTLAKAFSNPANSESYTVGFYLPDKTGGHAVTPYAVVDKGNGLYWIMVYDNNYPGLELYISVDKNANTWQYEGASMAGMEKTVYQGDASTKSLEIAPLSPRLEKQVCDFCSEAQTSKGNGLAAQTIQYNEIWLEGAAQLLISDEKGRRLGYEQGKFFNEIPEADVSVLHTGGLGDANPIFYLPVGMKFTAVLDGKQVDKKNRVDLVVIGPGYYIGVEEIILAANQKDTVTFDGSGKSLSYKTQEAETPVLIYGIEGKQYDYEIEVQANDVKPNIETIVEYEPAKDSLALHSSSPEDGVYTIAISRIDDVGVQTFETSADGVVLPPKYTIHFNLKDWSGQGKALKALYDLGGDGNIDEEKEIDAKQ